MVGLYKGEVVEENHYYPFGLTVQTSANQNVTKNDIKFQNQRHEDDFGINMYSFKYRDHDPQIGRFWEIDPLSESYVHNSVYAFSENKVTSHIELEGLEAITINPPVAVPTGGIGRLGGAFTVFNAWSNRVDAIKADPYKYPETGYGQMLIRQREEAAFANVVVAVIENAPAIATHIVNAIDKLNEGIEYVQQVVADVKPTSRGARREAMRKQGIPTSQQPKTQRKTKSGREYDYDVPAEGGSTKTKSVQERTMDRGHEEAPHWEAGDVKVDREQVQQNQYGSPKIKSTKSKVEYKD